GRAVVGHRLLRHRLHRHRAPAPARRGAVVQGHGLQPRRDSNLATAAARLGLRTGLVAGFGDDAYADWMWHTMESEEGIDLSASRRFTDFHSSLTVSIAAHG